MNRRLPAEWEEQDGVLLAWPHADTDWQSTLTQVQGVFIEIARAVSCYERLVIVAPDIAPVREQLLRAGIDPDLVALYPVATNDTWSRDFGPITVYEDDRPVLYDFGFNGWGLKFAAYHDNLVTAQLKAQGAFGNNPVRRPGLILEGGSIDSDGAGTVLTTARCLLSPNRNPHLDQHSLEQTLAELLGATRFLWLNNGSLYGDDTDAHIDTLARFCSDSTIAYVCCDDPRDEHHVPLAAMKQELHALRTADGRPYQLVPLPWPQPCYAPDGHRLPATYANFLVINKAVLVPTYGVPQDTAAVETIGRLFPDRKPIGINCRPLISQHGSLHCVTMHLPRGVLS
ncbi:MAG: agmatine deiminase family protein [Desulfobulbus sp.]|nr:agmatine deiminase family protein [Desulfobulbus sp.]